MNAALRVWWTFFTALPLQRWLGGIGVVLCGLLAIGGLASGEDGLWIGGLLVLFILAIFPTLFACPAVFRALSAPQANQLLPHFRARMLGAAALFVAALLAAFALFFLSGAPQPSRALPFEMVGYAFAFATAMFLWMFVQFGDARWVWLWIALPFVFSILGSFRSTNSTPLTAIPAWVWPAAALLAWIAFAAWYLRARRIGPIMLLLQPRAGARAPTDLEVTVAREVALRALVTAQLPSRMPQNIVFGSFIAMLLAGIVLAAMRPAGQLLPFTSFVWPFAAMLLLWGKATHIVHRSRLLWLRMPGPRDAVRREIERALRRNASGGLLLLVGVAVVYASPLVATAPQQVLAGFALTASAGLFATYLAFASVPGHALHLVSFGLMMGLQVALLARPAPSLTAVGIVTAVELVGAIAFRLLAIRRWRNVDWLRLRPLPLSSAWRGS